MNTDYNIKTKKVDGNQIWKIWFVLQGKKKIIKNKHLASTSILPFLGGEMIKIPVLGTDFG